MSSLTITILIVAAFAVGWGGGFLYFCARFPKDLEDMHNTLCQIKNRHELLHKEHSTFEKEHAAFKKDSDAWLKDWGRKAMEDEYKEVIREQSLEWTRKAVHAIMNTEPPEYSEDGSIGYVIHFNIEEGTVSVEYKK